MSALTVDRARSLLRYDADSGDLVWLVSRGKALAGSVVSCRDDRGYLVVGIDGRRHYAHRIAVLLQTGRDAHETVDHINGDRGDNRWLNLRQISVAMNTQNRHFPSKRSKTQVLGVRMFCGKYRATVSVNSKQRHLGTFETLAEASDAYLSAKRAYHEGCTL